MLIPQTPVRLGLALWVNFLSSLSLIMTNKYLYKIWRIHPVRLVCFHLFCTTFCNIGCNIAGFYKFKRVNIYRVLPLSLCFCGFVVLTNLSLETNTVGTYQILKCLSDPTLLLIQRILYKKVYSTGVQLAMIPMVLGIIINSAFDVSFSLLGLFYGLVAVGFTAFYTIWVGRKQQELDMNSMQLLMYQAPMSTVILSVSITISQFFGLMRNDLARSINSYNNGESLDGTALDILLQEPRSQSLQMLDLFEPKKFIVVISTGIAAYMVNFTTFWIIGNSSVITYAVFAKVKLCATIFCGFLIFGDPLNFRQCLGVLITLSGVFLYTYYKVQETLITKILNRNDNKVDDI